MRERAQRGLPHAREKFSEGKSFENAQRIGTVFRKQPSNPWSRYGGDRC